jgi:translation initiation factor IF-2
MGKQLAEANKAMFVETSAKTGLGVIELFTTVAENLHRVFGGISQN